MKANGEYKKVSKNFLKTEQRSQSHTASLQSKTPMKSSSSQKMALPSAELTDHCLIKTDFTLTITALDLFTFPDYKNKCKHSYCPFLIKTVQNLIYFTLRTDKCHDLFVCFCTVFNSFEQFFFLLFVPFCIKIFQFHHFGIILFFYF